MKIYYRCSNCGNQNNLPINATNRADIETNNNNGIVSICNYCTVKKVIRLNDIRAKTSKRNSIVLIFGVLISVLIGGIILSCYWEDNLETTLQVIEVFGIAITIPFLIASVIINEENKSIKIFNDYYV